MRRVALLFSAAALARALVDRLPCARAIRLHRLSPGLATSISTQQPDLELVAYKKLAGNQSADCPHNFGDPLVLYQ